MGSSKLVYSFSHADEHDPLLFGGKGAGLVELAKGGFPVPPGFIITTEACREFMGDNQLPRELVSDIRKHVNTLEDSTGTRFGGDSIPLLVSVRSGAPVSMPGMMDTVLNLGINPTAAIALGTACDDTQFAIDVMIRFHRMYADIVLGADCDLVEDTARSLLRERVGNPIDTDILRSLWLAMCQSETEDVGASVPEQPFEQLTQAVSAVFNSWNTRRAKTYRRLHRIPDSLGTAVVVQAMVFGNLGSPSGSGVAFTRNPTTGAPGLFGEYLEGGQGEEVVSGTKTPEPIADAARRLPEVFAEFEQRALELERSRRDVLDIEFTIERGKCYFLQVRSAKRTAAASLRIAANFLSEGRVSPVEALSRVTPEEIREVERPSFLESAVTEARARGKLLAKGIPASLGQVHGIAVLDPDRAEEMAAAGHSVILLRSTTSPLDLHGMIASKAIVTARGGATSHAAVVARALGRPAVVGCRDLDVGSSVGSFVIGGRSYPEETVLSVDGGSGEIFEGEIPLTDSASASSDLETVLEVAGSATSDCRLLAVCTTVEQVFEARRRGAGGVAVRLSDLLLASGAMDGIPRELLRRRGRADVDLSDFEVAVAALLTPMLDAAEDASVVIRAVDFNQDEMSEVVDLDALLVDYPTLGLPLGVQEFLRMQLAAVARASGESASPVVPHFIVRHVSDTNELAELGRMAAEQGARPGHGPLEVGAFVTTPLGVQRGPELAAGAEIIWFDAQRLMASMTGYPPSVFSAREPLDEYIRGGWLSEDPREGKDIAQMQVYSLINGIRVRIPDCSIGIRIGTPIPAGMLEAYYRSGARTFAMDSEELRVAALVLGKAALSSAS